MSWFRLRIALEEAFCCATRPMEGNETPSTPWIPATNIRGAIATALAIRGDSDRVPSLFGSSGPRWLPAWQVPKNERDQFMVPAPRCYATDKAGGFEGIRNLYVRADAPPSANPDNQPQWQSLNADFCLIEPGLGRVVATFQPALATSMHVGLKYFHQASRDAALFSRSERPSGTVFEAWVSTSDPSHDLTDLPPEISLGKRRSAGNGLAGLEVSSTATPPWVIADNLEEISNHRLRIQLMTDAILPESRGGFWRGLSIPAIEANLWPGAPRIEAIKCFSEDGTLPGWSGAWGLPREQARVIRAGSTCELTFGSAVADSALAQFANKLREGIGIRRVEGFGEVAVNPRWLYTEHTSDPKEPEEIFSMKAADWPGESPKHTWLTSDLALEAERLARTVVRQGLKGKLNDFANYAARSQGNPADYLSNMAGRPNDRGWHDAESCFKPFLKINESDRPLSELRFLLGAAASLAGKESSR